MWFFVKKSEKIVVILNLVTNIPTQYVVGNAH